ncbi:MAG TPA: tetratricopeptide repeat protein, partial [Candidatus Obscuribacterales bacterium]
IAHYNLGITHYRLNNYAEAVTAFKETTQLDPQFVSGFISLGNALDDLGKFQPAITAYRQALQLEPNNASAYLNMGIAYARQNQTKAAIAALKKAKTLYQTEGDLEAVQQIEQMLQQLTTS